MFGGVADKYKLYKQIGEPFKEGKFYYVMVQMPFSKKPPEKVRFYTDKAHGQSKSTSPLWKLFYFESEKDEILVIKRCWLSKELEEEYFERSEKWRGSALFGGCWYAAKNTEIPPNAVIERKIMRCDWPTWKKEAKANAISIGADADCIWLKGE